MPSTFPPLKVKNCAAAINLIKIAKKINLAKIAFVCYDYESRVDSSLTKR